VKRVEGEMGPKSRKGTYKKKKLKKRKGLWREPPEERMKTDQRATGKRILPPLQFRNVDPRESSEEGPSKGRRRVRLSKIQEENKGRKRGVKQRTPDSAIRRRRRTRPNTGGMKRKVRGAKEVFRSKGGGTKKPGRGLWVVRKMTIFGELMAT